MSDIRVKLSTYLLSLHPGENWFRQIDPSLGEVYSNYESLDSDKTIPSESDCQAGIQALQTQIDNIFSEEEKKNAFRAESDPLFFKWQAGEATEQEWLDKRNEIKARFS